MFNMRNTIKSLFANDCYASYAKYAGTEVYNISRKVGRDEIYVGNLVVAQGDFFTINVVTAEGTETHTGIGFIELAQRLQALNLLHPDQPI